LWKSAFFADFHSRHQAPLKKWFPTYFLPPALCVAVEKCLVLFQAAEGKAAQRFAFSSAAAASTAIPDLRSHFPRTLFTHRFC